MNIIFARVSPIVLCLTKFDTDIWIVNRVDTDQDSLLSVTELEAWVLKKMEEHFAEAMEENEEIFKHLDPDGNGEQT